MASVARFEECGNMFVNYVQCILFGFVAAGLDFSLESDF